MQPESQVLVREFNRRLRAALRGVPNHVRMEAALEVESHVQDVLSRSRNEELPEPEQVARILSGFGSPEEYARALALQLPEAEVVSVGGGLREIGLALSDLVRGTGRLGLALVRNTAALATAAARLLWRGAGEAGARGRSLLAASREPAGRVWKGLRSGGRRAGAGLLQVGALAGRMLTRGSRLAMSGLRTASRLARRGLWWGGILARQAGHFTSHLATTGLRNGEQVLRFLAKALRWLLRTAALTALGLVILASFALAAFAALAPDVVGWFVLMANQEVARAIAAIRAETIGWFSPAPPEQLAVVGEWVLRGALATGLILTALLGVIIWQSRRRRSAATG